MIRFVQEVEWAAERMMGGGRLQGAGGFLLEGGGMGSTAMEGGCLAGQRLRGRDWEGHGGRRGRLEVIGGGQPRDYRYVGRLELGWAEASVIGLEWLAGVCRRTGRSGVCLAAQHTPKGNVSLINST